MSRIGKQPVAIPFGIEVKVDNNGVITIKKGSNSTTIDTLNNVNIEVKDGNIIFSLKNDDKQSRAFWGTYRSLANNAIVGLDKGFSKSLEINGVGYRAAIKGNILELQLGFSHPINYNIPNGIKIGIEKNIIKIDGSNKQLVGQVAAKIRGFRPPEPYKGKGVKYVEEHIVRKAGKTAK